MGLPGAARLALAGGVVHLDPASAVFEAMLEGWATQQRARFLKDNTIGPRVELVRRFAAFTNQYPWQWEPAEAEAFIARSPVAVSTARNYQVTLRLFCAMRPMPVTGGGGVPGAVRLGAAADPG